MENMETIKQPIILGKIAQIEEAIDRLEDILSPVLISELDIEKEEANSEPPKSTAIRNKEIYESIIIVRRDIDCSTSS